MLSALLLLLLVPIAASAQQLFASEPPVVVTTGEGLIKAVPDRAWITITAESRARNARDAQRRNADVVAPLIDKLRAAGIPAAAIRTIGYDLQQQWDYVNSRRVSRGHVARSTIDVRVDAIDRVGELLEIAVGSGATAVGDVRFDLKDRRKLELQALRMAVDDARTRADAAAAGAGRSIDRVLRIDARPVSGGPVPMRRFALTGERVESDAPSIAVGQLEIRAQVTLTSILK